MARSRHGVQYATTMQRSAALSSPFGYKVACEKFGPALIDAMPKVSKGPRKGALKGFIVWQATTEGGWSRERGGVLYPGNNDWRIQLGYPDGGDREGVTVVARWESQGRDLPGKVTFVRPVEEAHEAQKRLARTSRW